jgi:3,4-dihydroxy 2-butanone 4-phosphate synthase/GTP cyclohydrolase II
MMRGEQLAQFATTHGIQIISIAELKEIAPAKITDSKTEFTWANLPIANQNWQITTFTSDFGTEHAVLKFGDLSKQPLLRIHSECLTGDVFGSQRCDCGEQLSKSISLVEAAGNGLIIYLRDHEGRGIGLAEKIKAYQLQDNGADTVAANLTLGHPVDDRDYQDAINILHRLNISEVNLLTNNPIKASELMAAGIRVTQLPIQVPSNKHNQNYLKSKKEILNHALGDI